MIRTTGTAAFTALLVLVALLIGPGCSREGSLEPTEPAFESLQSSEAVTAAPAEPTNFVETFDSRRNVGKWSFQTLHKHIFEDAGGNPGGYLHDDNVVSFAPHPGTELGEESIFTGDYREKRVTSLGIDLRSIDYDYDITKRYLTLILMNDNGTPLDIDDDWGAYFIGSQTLPSKYVASLASTTENEPGWVSYDFEIASQTSELPEGWSFIRWTVSSGEMPGGSWTKLMQNVSYVQFHYGDPELYYILQNFDLGLDNPRISWE